MMFGRRRTCMGLQCDLRTGTLLMGSDLEVRYTRGYTLLLSDGNER